MIEIKYTPLIDYKNLDGLICFMPKACTGCIKPSLKKIWEKTVASNFERKQWTIATDEIYLDVHFIIMPETDDAVDDIEVMINNLTKALRHLKGLNINHICIDTTGLFEKYDQKRTLSRRLAETSYLVACEGFSLKSKDEASGIENIFITGDKVDTASVDEGIILAIATDEARTLVNRPANDLTPEALAEKVIELGKTHGFETTVHDQSKIEQLKMHAFLLVAKGSFEEPKLIIMRYCGNSNNDQAVGLVGKGLTYDSGGLSIKPTGSMVNMKDDMGGAAAVIGAFIAASKAKLNINLIGVIAACENMISGECFRPGDIIQTMAGKTVYIGNTDAEGRLTLIDAMHYIQNQHNIKLLIDLATLTGAALHCLGEEMAPVVTNDDAIYGMAEKAFSKSGEPIWRMPLTRAYREKVKHTEADLTNSAGRPGMITAAAFLEAFVKKDMPWIHFDIAGPVLLSKAQGDKAKGGTGYGVRGLYHMLKKISH